MEVHDHNRARRTMTVLSVVCVVLQLAIAPQISVFGGSINFTMILAGCIGLMYGSAAGTTAGFLAGLLHDLTAPVPVGLMMLVLAVGGFVLGLGDRNRVAESFSSSAKSFAVFSLVANIVYGIALFLSGHEGDLVVSIFGHGLVCAILTSLAACIVLLVLSGGEGSRPHSGRRVGGTRFRGVR